MTQEEEYNKLVVLYDQSRPEWIRLQTGLELIAHYRGQRADLLRKMDKINELSCLSTFFPKV